MSDSAPPRLGESLRGLADTGLGVLQTRLELFAVELKEEKLRVGSFLFDTVLAALFIGFGIVFLLAFLTVLMWDEHRLLALGLATAGLFTAGIYAATRAATRLRAGSRLFAASLAELAQDRDALRPED
ncbi:MAG TPA: phage holin family protein [Rhodocyclaceae bacterium]|nr:phage holin family protein [Rhodocyclaceae bacterium]HNI82152.1 phage holin family protein [Rhodocyclaceae bacterium]